MLFVLLAWIVQFTILVGWGALLWHLLVGRGASSSNVFQLFWLGFCGLVLLLQLVSLVLPLRAIWLGVICLLACFGWRVLYQQRPLPRPRWSLGTVLFVGFLVLVSLRAAANVGLPTWTGDYDTDLYHFSAVRWAKNFPAVPGLANLHIRLGLSSSFLLYAAFVDHGFWHQRSAWLAQSLFIVVGLAQWLWVMFGDRRAPFRAKMFCWFSLPWLMSALGSLQPSLYYDKPSLLLQAVVMLELLHFSWGEMRQTAGVEPRRLLPMLGLPLWLAATAFTIKPLGVATLLGTGLLLMLALWRSPHKHGWEQMWPWGLLSTLALPPVLLLAGWLARNALLTGWLFFPVSAGQLPVTWAVPEQPANRSHAATLQSVRGLYDVVCGWARQPGAECMAMAQAPLSVWWPDWWRRHHTAPEWIFIGVGFALAALAGICGRWRKADPPLIIACLVLLGNFAQWLLLAPEWRFGDAFFSIGLGLGAVLLWPTGSWRPFIAALAAFTVAIMGWWWCAHPATAQPPVWWHIGDSGRGHCQPVELQNGQQPPLIVWVPEGGEDRCGDAPLPCTPYPQDALCCRTPGNLRDGFYIARSPTRQP